MTLALNPSEARKKPRKAFFDLVSDLSDCQTPERVKKVACLWGVARKYIKQAAKHAKEFNRSPGSPTKRESYLRILRMAREKIELKAEELGADLSDCDIGGPRGRK